MPITATEEFFATLVSDIKTYSGKDPLLPWLHGIRKMRDRLTPQLLKEKLPRFLQKCAQTFEKDRRYKNDLRYLRVWLQLMDFVDDPKSLLRTMEVACIGTKRSLFYQAYALYYEKMKNFENAEKMYRLGVHNLAEPADALQKSYDQFIHRLARYKNSRMQGKNGGFAKRQKQRNVFLHHDQNKENDNSICSMEINSIKSSSSEKLSSIVLPVQAGVPGKRGCDEMLLKSSNHIDISRKNVFGLCNVGVGTASMEEVLEDQSNDAANAGNSEAEDATHHVGSTINSKEASCAINDESEDKGDHDGIIDKGGRGLELPNVRAFVFPNAKGSDDSIQPGEDTIICRFVGSAILDEPKVENACHHGLIEPTVNLKQAMDDINDMFGRPMDSVRPKRPRKKKGQEKISGGFSILPDDDLEDATELNQGFSILAEDDKCDLFEPTQCTKEAMDGINKLFGMPLDF